MTYKFRVGQSVYYSPRNYGPAASGTYKIIRLLPVENDARLRYRIKSSVETHERVADEAQLSPAN